MRWDELFEDLDGQVESAANLQLSSEVADRTRREAAQLRLVDRLLGALSQPVRLQVCGVGEITGHLQQVSVDSLVLGSDGERQALVPLDAILSLAGLTRWSSVPHTQGQVFERLRLTSAIRRLARDRADVRVVLRDGASATGTIDRVGEDFFELAEHAAGEARRRDQVSGVRLVPVSGVGAILSF